MRFSFMLSVDAQAGDQLDDLRDQFEALGHEFVVNRGIFLPPPWFNVFCEGVSEVTNNPRLVQSLAEAGYQMIVLVTEEPTLVSSEGLVWNYRTSDDWMGRADCFVEGAPYMTAAWCYAPDTAKIIKRFVSRAADIDMVWGKRFRPVPPPRASAVSRVKLKPRYDFCFFGSLTRRRERIINEFIRCGHSVDIIPHATSLADRDRRVPNSRVVLDLKQYAWWDLASSVRYVTSIGYGRPVVAEARSAKAQGDWAPIVRFAKEGEFYGCAVEALGEWESLHARQLAALKRKPSMMAAAVAILPEPPDIVLPTVDTKPKEQKRIRVNAVAQNTVHNGPRPKLLESFGGANLVSWKGFIYAIPHQSRRVHLEEIDLSRHPEIRKYPDLVTARRGVG